jgi:hypothetical protein
MVQNGYSVGGFVEGEEVGQLVAGACVGADAVGRSIMDGAFVGLLVCAVGESVGQNEDGDRVGQRVDGEMDGALVGYFVTMDGGTVKKGYSDGRFVDDEGYGVGHQPVEGVSVGFLLGYLVATCGDGVGEDGYKKGELVGRTGGTVVNG